MQDKFQTNTEMLKEYASFLKKNHLEQMAEVELKIVSKMDIPLMKFFVHLSHDELKALTVKGLEEFLTNIENDLLYEANAESLKKWENDDLEGGIPKDAIQPQDLVLVYGAQKLTMLHFLPVFTQDSKVAVDIISSLLTYYMRIQELAYSVLIKIRKEAEDALKESEEKFRAVSQSAVDGILLIDKKGKLIFWNSGAERMFGYSQQEVLHNYFSILLPPEFYEILDNDLKEFWKTGKSEFIGKTTEVRACRKDGTEFPVEISLSSFETSGGKLVSAIVHDITETKNTARKLEKSARRMEASNKELEQFAYIASHDMKEPLRMVTNYLQLLQKKIGGQLDEESKEYIEYAVNGATRMRTLITDLLEFSRVNRTDRKLEELDLNEVIEEVLTNLDPQIREKNAIIKVDKLPVICSDRLQMVQLFQNLLSNAVKFSNQKQPLISINKEQQDNGQKWLFCVKDNGIGIDPQYGDKIFQMFQRLHSKQDYPGSGIGLAICKKIVERFGGNIWFESEPGEGTTFFFTLETNPVLNEDETTEIQDKQNVKEELR